MRIALVMSALLLSACAAQLDPGLSRLVGSHIRSAFDALGYPNSQMTVDDMKIYHWHSSQRLVGMVPQTSFSRGTVYSGASSANFYGTTTGSTPISTNNDCNIWIEADEDNIIRSYKFTGWLTGWDFFRINCVE